MVKLVKLETFNSLYSKTEEIFCNVTWMKLQTESYIPYMTKRRDRMYLPIKSTNVIRKQQLSFLSRNNPGDICDGDNDEPCRQRAEQKP